MKEKAGEKETGSEVEGETYKIKTKREQTGSLGPQHIVNKKVRKTTKKQILDISTTLWHFPESVLVLLRLSKYKFAQLKYQRTNVIFKSRAFCRFSSFWPLHPNCTHPSLFLVSVKHKLLPLISRPPTSEWIPANAILWAQACLSKHEHSPWLSSLNYHRP